MKPSAKKSTDDMRMSGAEFDRIMAQALRIKPEETKKKKRSVKTKVVPKKKSVPK